RIGDQHHRRVRDRACRLARVRDLEVRRRAAASRRALLHLDNDANQLGTAGAGRKRAWCDSRAGHLGGTPMTDTVAERSTLHLARWTCASGSNSRSRGAVVVESGDHRWQASAEGNGPVDALFRAVDTALRDVLSGNPRLVAYDVHALNE